MQIEEESEFEYEDFASDDDDTNSEINCKLNEYYCVYYDDRFYVGKIIEIGDQILKIKFLKPVKDQWVWPTIWAISVQNIFFMGHSN